MVQAQELDELLLHMQYRATLMREFAERMGVEYFEKLRANNWDGSAQVWRSFRNVVGNECDLYHENEYWYAFNLRAGGR